MFNTLEITFFPADASPLLLAVINNHTAILKLLIKHKCNVSVQYSGGRNVLHIATERNRIQSIFQLLRHGKDTARLVDDEDNEGETPWNIAWDNERGEILMMYVNGGNKMSPYVTSCILRYGLEQGVMNDITMELYLKKELEVGYLVPRQFKTFIHLAVVSDTMYRWVPNLHSMGVRVDAIDIAGRSALHLATMSGNEDAVAVLMDHSPNTKMVDNSGSSALHYAVIAGSDRMVRLLVITGSMWDVPNRDGLTAFQLACSLGHYNIMRTFLEEGSDPNWPSQNEAQDSPLALVLKSDNGSVSCAKLLLDNGARADVLDDKGNNVLHEAVYRCCTDAKVLVEPLLGKGMFDTK